MTRDKHETMELFQGPVARAIVKQIKESADSLSNDFVAYADKVLREGLKSMFEGLEDGHKSPKVFIFHTLTKEYQLEQVGGANCTKGSKTEPNTQPIACGSLLSRMAGLD